MARKKAARKRDVKKVAHVPKIEVVEPQSPERIMIIRTNVQIKREDYMKILELRSIAQQEIDPVEMKRAWGFFHGFIDDLAVNSYRLPKRTGIYGISKDGYFTYTNDSVEVSKVDRPDFHQYMTMPLDMNPNG